MRQVFLLSVFCLFQLLYAAEVNSYYMFFVYYFIVVVTFFPKYIFSPLSLVHAFYGLWYVVAPTLASGYTIEVLSLPEYQESYFYIQISYTAIIFTLSFFDKFNVGLGGVRELPLTPQGISFYECKIIFALYFLSTIMVVLVVQNSGGFLYWIKNPGDAFLNRAGTGLYVVASHFFGMLLALYVGYLSYIRNRKGLLFFFLVWLFSTSAVHGSKLQIIIFLAYLFLPRLFYIRSFSIKSFFILVLCVAIFIYGMVLRTEGDVDFERVYSYLNYFSTLHNLAISIRDFEPSFLTTWFLPFKKFLTPLGLENRTMYYDMNHMLTDIYYPDAWDIRATEQWPVETDLYLNFYFYFGLPILAGYFAMIGFFYSKAIGSNNYGYMVLSASLILYIVSHLRGSLYNHVDFYLYPMIMVFFFVFRRKIYGQR